MKVSVSMKCDADKALKRLTLMHARSMNFKPLFYYAQKELERANAANFAAGGLPAANGPWRPRKKAEPWPLMVRSGRLLRSLTNLFAPPNNVGLTEAEFGTSVEYAKFHQYGTTRMPARKIVFEPSGFARDLASKAANYVANGRL